MMYWIYILDIDNTLLCKAVFGVLLSCFNKSRGLIYVLNNISTTLHNHSYLGSLVPKQVR